ncbi:hypothetical protein MIN45_P0478 [Methylomarinovum tepidoasis]|uniref:DUF4384 domain-containing protein n=1 Tax=Methylomarinovum tepidoasis TaxID=2840183 RepID=A0AAU9CBM7_9GAMM|nr:DUF4384 domain-containing protein [Methylomarinovum sp. IN45]BCX88111.1 hypothetical protein MIN45_P0478 [Methylomarinovum sp. IN45]
MKACLPSFLYPLRHVLLSTGILCFISACGINPQDVDLDLNTSLPEVKTTVFSEAIHNLGRLNAIYGRDPLYIMAKPAFDRTGTSLPTQGEIPQDISEMVKSTLNAIGGGIWYVPYDPEFMLNTAQTGYSEWGDKLLPNVVLVGGLTEFDRGLVTKEEGADVSGSAEELGVPMGLDFEDTRKSSLARITLDFNLLDFKTFTGIPFMQAVNSIQVHKGLGVDQLGFTVYGQTLGLRGNIKKIQGRHAATRLLVQLSILQIIGKYQKLPYWRLIPNAEPDPVVLDALRDEFYRLEQPDRIAKIQELLYLYGKDVEITGKLDAKTRTAISQFKQEKNLSAPDISEEIYLALFESVPLDRETLARRQRVDRLLAAYNQRLRELAFQAQAAPTAAVEPQTPPPKATHRIGQKKSQPTEPKKKSLGEVRVWLSKSAYQIGEPLEIFFEVTEPMFVRIITINSVGKMATLFPNPYQNDNFARPGKVYRIPPANAPVKLTVGAPVGTDTIYAIASVNPIPADSLPLDDQGHVITEGIEKRFAFAEEAFQILPSSASQAAVETGGDQP